MHYWTSYCARQALGVKQPQAKGSYPLGDRRYNRRYNRPTTADCSADCSRRPVGVGVNRLVGMGLKGPPGPGGHNNLSNSALDGLLYFISPL